MKCTAITRPRLSLCLLSAGLGLGLYGVTLPIVRRALPLSPNTADDGGGRDNGGRGRWGGRKKVNSYYYYL